MKSLVLTLAIFSASAHAQTIGLHLFSEHASDTYNQRYTDGSNTDLKYNEYNYGLYYINRDGWTVGAYRNSYRNHTVYAGYVWDGPRFGPVGTHIAGALATGYRNVEGVGVLRPMLMPSVTLGGRTGPVVRWQAAPTKGGFFQHVSIEYRF